eukprot:7346104-Pyramimonas_sp.AAC.1
MAQTSLKLGDREGQDCAPRAQAVPKSVQPLRELVLEPPKGGDSRRPRSQALRAERVCDHPAHGPVRGREHQLGLLLV